MFIILFISVMALTREAALSVGAFSLLAIVRLAFVYVCDKKSMDNYHEIPGNYVKFIKYFPSVAISLIRHCSMTFPPQNTCSVP